MESAPRICAVLASDAAFFHQTRAAIESIRKTEIGDIDIRLIAIGRYEPFQSIWLDRWQVAVFDQTDALPRFKDGPPHALALTCRPYLPTLFPEFDGFVWIDSDVRFLDPGGLSPWVTQASNPQCTIAVAHEAESAYAVNWMPELAKKYHRSTFARMLEVHGQKVADHFEYFKLYNAGLFAMPACSPVWDRYRANLLRAVDFPYDRLREQDALNVAIAETGEVWTMPSTLNWLCSLATPVLGSDGKWTPRDHSNRWIKVAHLSESPDLIEYDGQVMTWYDCYRKLGLAE